MKHSKPDPLDVFTLELYKHKNNFIIAAIQLDMANKVDDHDNASYYELVGMKSLNKMRGVIEAIFALGYDLEHIEHNLDMFGDLDKETYKRYLENTREGRPDIIARLPV